MSAFAAMFGETEQPTGGSNVVAPKKSKFTNVNPQLQPEENDLDQMMLGTVKPTNSTEIKQEPQKTNLATKTIQSLFEAKKKAQDLAFGVVAPVVEPLATLATGAQAGVIGPLTGLVAAARSGKYGTQQGVDIARQQAENYAQQTTYQPRTESGKAVTEAIGNVAQKVGQVGPIPELYGFAPVGSSTAQRIKPNVDLLISDIADATKSIADKTKSALPKVSIERVNQPAMQSGGAAATTNKTILDEAISRASPELAAQLKKENPATIDPVALERYLDADTVGVRLTKGQASQDPTLISNERNARGQDPQLVERFNEQNKALLEKAAEVKEKAAPDVYAPDYVANAEGALEYISNKVRQNETATGDAYRALDEFGAGKIEVDSKTFADNAMKALSAKEDIDFLPTTIANKIKSYQEGKPMNFDQYENLRTQIARETRKAQQAGDGNAAHALSLVRSELEKLPLIGETAEAKPLADKARATAKAEFDLVNRSNPAYNKVYADYVNGVTDTKDFIQSAVLRSKNKDFAKTMELFDDPVAKQNLRAGALDLIIKDATDTSGNFKPAKFAKAIENLDVNKKLDALFGEEAQTLRKIAKTGQLVEARPAGAFVNESNTAVTQMATEYAKRLASKTPLVGGLVEPAINIMAERSAKKATQESLRPGAAVKLKNIGKE